MMKRLLIPIFIGLLFVFTGCNDEEGYSLSNMWVGFGILDEASGSSSGYRIAMDNGDILIPVASNTYHPWYYHDNDGGHSQLVKGDRILLNYTVLGDDKNDAGKVVSYFVKVNSIKKILMKGILDITTENQDSIGNDPVIVSDSWRTDSLLNFKIKYWGRNKIHYINLVKKPGFLTAAGQPIELELRHNGNEDSEDIPFVAYVSFKLDALKIAGLDSVRFKVTSTDYDGKVFKYEGVYKYGKKN